MRTVLIIVLLLVVALLAVAVVVLRRQRDDARADVGEDRTGRTVVVVDVRNANDLAAKRTSLARALSFVAPGVTRSLVHREVVRQLKGELADAGVQAEIRVRRWPGSTAASAMNPVVTTSGAATGGASQTASATTPVTVPESSVAAASIAPGDADGSPSDWDSEADR